MSHFYGYLQGTKGQTTRCGTKTSGINSHVRSWNNDVYVSIDAGQEEKDKISFSINEVKNIDEIILSLPLNAIVKINNKNYIITEEGLKQTN